MSKQLKGAAHARRAIAAQAARLIAEDGVGDFGSAKRKAARQLGFRESDGLPDNDEIEEALRTYQTLYQNDEQRARLLDLRHVAVEVMREFEAHSPYLAGSVWKGTASRGAGVDINLFTDLEKQVEMALLGRGIEYTTSERSHFNRSVNRKVPVFSFDVEGVTVHLVVYSSADERGAARPDASGQVDRGNLTAVELLIDEEEQKNTVDQFLSNIR
ncbi:MAG TPA: hypothetical protein VGN52_05175 [Burkholderiales bacterium]|jgi:hypothetical protein